MSTTRIQNYKLYGFGTEGYSKDLNTSAYWMDQDGLNQMQAKHYIDGQWDKQGVKDSMALPCFNRANSIDVVEVTESHIVVESDIGKATELIQYSNDSGYSTGFNVKDMSGGGTQIAPNPQFLKPN